MASFRCMSANSRVGRTPKPLCSGFNFCSCLPRFLREAFIFRSYAVIKLITLKKILICEDEEILLTALKFRLQKQGYELSLADDGQKAKELIDSEKPDLVVTDIELPHVNGLELIHYLRKDLKRDTPIVLIAPMENDEAILSAMKDGGTDFVTKPFKPVELVLRIRRIFQDAE